MIVINGRKIELNRFPDNTLLVKEEKYNDFTLSLSEPIYAAGQIRFEWFYEDDSELFALYCLGKHLKTRRYKMTLYMPYIPNARQDRVKTDEDVPTLKYFAEIINSIGFDVIYVVDPHSSVSEALVSNIQVLSPKPYIKTVENMIMVSGKYADENGNTNLVMFYPDEGAMKRYSGMISRPYAFGIKKREWESGKIVGLDVAGEINDIKDNTILIVDDICSKGGTFYHSAKKLKELGAKHIILYITHCENTIFSGELINSELIDEIYTTNSIFNADNETIRNSKIPITIMNKSIAELIRENG